MGYLLFIAAHSHLKVFIELASILNCSDAE